jgi:hypothetical protein
MSIVKDNENYLLVLKMSEGYCCPLGSTGKQFLTLGKKKVGPPGECDKSPHTLVTAERPVSSG